MNSYGEKTGARMNKQPVIIVDSDAIIGRTDVKDPHHHKVVEITEKLITLNARVIYPATAIAESNAFMQRILNSKSDAYNIAVLFTGSNFEVAQINQDTLKSAIKYFSPTSSKKNTL